MTYWSFQSWGKTLMRKPSGGAMAVAVLAVALAVGGGRGGASAAALDAPATAPAEQMASLVRQLAADDPADRERAYRQLLHLSPRDLPALRELVRSGAARLPAQREALRDVVRHVFLVGEAPPAGNPGLSFLGVTAPAFHVEVNPSTVGMTFTERLPGFPAYAALQDGDIVVGVAEAPSVAINNELVLRTLREQFPPGSRIHFRVVRDGVVVDVPITLAPTPNWPVAEGNQQQYRRLERADAFWETQFEPAFADPTS